MQFVWTLTLTLILHSYLFPRKEHNKKQLNMMSHKIIVLIINLISTFYVIFIFFSRIDRNTTEFIEQMLKTSLLDSHHKRFLIEEFDHGSD